MIGIFLITHGRYGEALLANARHVLNRPLEGVGQLGVAAQEDPSDLLPCARQQVDALDVGEGVLLLTDIFGATPANLALKLIVPGRIEGITGVNLPMLLRALTYRDKGLDVLLVRARDGGRDGIFNMRDHH